RFEQDAAYSMVRAGLVPAAVAGRRRADIAHGALDTVLAAPDVQWAGRTTVNPIHRLGDVHEWTMNGKGAIHPPTGATLRATEGPETDHAYVELTVPLLGGAVAAAKDAVRSRLTV
ncbi:hypothetical protein IU474_33380, partial [Nocardia otitidiscaviarum]|uniref:hypothetical protein n=1 Tax=Nocardia otitidiscaviarum TaxID=1823 RepID=UPI00189371D2